MRHALKRRVALLLIGLLVFSQASVALAACSMDRGMLAQTVAAAAEDACSGCDTMGSADGPSNASLCVAHCTSDLQLAAIATTIVSGPAEWAVLVVSLPAVQRRIGLAAPPPGAPPHRILLHSFLI